MINFCLTAQKYKNCGNALTKIGRYQEAIEKYRQAVAIDPSLAEEYHNWGKVLKEMGSASGKQERCEMP